MASEEQKKLSSFIKQVHSDLRHKAKLEGVNEAWVNHCKNEEKLKEYAKCMNLLATKYWDQTHNNDIKKSRNSWILYHIDEYFNKNIYMIKRLKEEREKIKNNINCNIKISSFSKPYKLLDVGSCYNPFYNIKYLNTIGIDLYPANNNVYKCDFLNLNIEYYENKKDYEEAINNVIYFNRVNDKLDENKVNDELDENKVNNELDENKVNNELDDQKVHKQNENNEIDKNTIIHVNMNIEENNIKQKFISNEIYNSNKKLKLENKNEDIIKESNSTNINQLEFNDTDNSISNAPNSNNSENSILNASNSDEFTILKTTNSDNIINSEETNNNFKIIKSLPCELFDIIIFSLFLGYIPCSKLRFNCCISAYNLLKYEGIIIIITPDSKHETCSNIKIIKQWKLILKQIGFNRIKYEKLKHLHCMIFRKSSLDNNYHNNIKGNEKLIIPQDIQSCN